MASGTHDLDLLQAARSEDLVDDEISELTVLGDFERKTVDVLKQSGAHLLQGSRGVGKSMLMRWAEVEMDNEFDESRKLAVYVNFKTSTLLDGVTAEGKDAFQIWVCTKILEELHEKLLKLDLIEYGNVENPYSKVFGLDQSNEMKEFIQDKIHQLQKLATASDKNKTISDIGIEFLDKIYDISFIHELIKDVINEFRIHKIVFLFDEAAHTFIPKQQEIFFEIFKSLHGGTISVKAAVYPSVTSYGRNFEIGQDAIVVSMDRLEIGGTGRKANRELFRDILTKRLPKTGKTTKRIFSKGYLLDQCIDLSTGNPRAFLHLLNRTIEKGYTDRALLLSTQEFVDQELLPYHTNLSKRLPRYSHHVDVGLELLRGYIVQEIKNKNYREKKSGYQSAFFTIERDMSANLKLALDILCYSGLLKSQGTVKIAERKTGLRYMVHLGLLFTEKAFVYSDLTESMNSLSLTDYREFKSSDPNIETYMIKLKESSDKCMQCSYEIPANAKYCPECGHKIENSSIISGLLEEPVSQLSISIKLVDRIKPTFSTVGDIIYATREDLMRIPYIKEVRSRIIKNAADEFISG